MLKIYGSYMCPDCQACKANFDANQIEYEFIDCMASLANLKKFLSYRDHEPVFDRLKAIGDIGFPAIVAEDGAVFTDWEGWMKEHGYTPQPIVTQGQACSIDHKGC